MPLYRGDAGSGGTALPTTQPGKVLGSSAEGELVWVEPQSKFRGAWAADSLAKFYDFSSGTIPADFTLSVTGAGVTPVATTVATALTNYTHCVRFNAGNILQNAHTSAMTLSLASLGITGITRLTAWMSTAIGTNSQYKSTQIVKNGTVGAQVAGNPVAWVKHSVSCTSSDVMVFRQTGAYASAAGQSTPSYITGIDIFATANPYMRGDYVTYQNRMWLSEVDTNAGTPGVAGWTQALDLPVVSGITASRPTASLVGPGYQYYDTTLGKPIWSNGTAWTDSAGTVV